MLKTERAEIRIAVKQDGDGAPFLMIEPTQGTLNILSRAFLTFDMKPGTSLDEARKLADALNAGVRALAHTQF